MIRRNTWVVLAIFAILLLAAVLWQRSKDESAAQVTPTAGQPFLFDLDGAVMTGLQLSDGQDRDIVLQRGEDGLWKLVEPSAEQTDTGAVDTAITQLLSLQALAELEAPPTLEAMGLQPPAYNILITLDSGKQLIAKIGNLTATGSGYYVLTGERDIYIVSKYSLEAVLSLLDEPPVLVTPTLEALPALEVTETPATSAP